MGLLTEIIRKVFIILVKISFSNPKGSDCILTSVAKLDRKNKELIKAFINWFVQHRVTPLFETC